MLSSREYNDVLGLPEVEAWEQRFDLQSKRLSGDFT